MERRRQLIAMSNGFYDVLKFKMDGKFVQYEMNLKVFTRKFVLIEN